MSIISESKFLIQKIADNTIFTNYLHASIPFCLFKLPNIPKQFNQEQLCLPMNRYTDNQLIFNSKSYISVWSENHIKFLSGIKNKKLLNMNKVILKNPFKSEQLIQNCLKVGINTMVIEDFDEMAKIHKSRTQQLRKLQYSPIDFVFSISDYQTDLQKIKTLASYKIKIKSLLFNDSYSGRFPLIKEFIKKANQVLQNKESIKRLFIQTNQETYQLSKEQIKKDNFLKNNKIQTIIQNNDYSMTDKYLIGVKIIGENKNKQFVVNEQVKYYVNQQSLKNGKIFQNQGKKWILSQINHFPEPQIMEQHKRKGFITNIN